MAELRPQLPVLLIVAVFSRHRDVLQWGREQLEQTYGPVQLAGEPYHFNQTTYYARTMGADLHKQLLAFRNLVLRDCLPKVKLHTNTLEQALAGTGAYPEDRPLNLDPGVLELGKFLLATTKDQAHRVYLRDGIFAEVTLYFQTGAWHPSTWTYADYRQTCVQDFLLQARDYYVQCLHQIRAQSASFLVEDKE